jgi:arginase
MSILIPILHIQNASGQKHRGVILEKSQIERLIPSPLDVQYQISLFTESENENANLVNRCVSQLEESPFCIYLGGDHSTSFATILASLEKYGAELRVLWVDAHADIHSPETSPSGNTHGMPVRFLMTHPSQLKPEQIMYVGLRSVENEEWDFIHSNNIRYITAECFLKDPAASYSEIRAFLENRPVHFSFDVDALDPSIMPSTGTAEENGLNLEEFYEILSICNDAGAPFFAIDIMEYNPMVGTISEKKNAMNTMRHLFQRIYNIRKI